MVEIIYLWSFTSDDTSRRIDRTLTAPRSGSALRRRSLAFKESLIEDLLGRWRNEQSYMERGAMQQAPRGGDMQLPRCCRNTENGNTGWINADL